MCRPFFFLLVDSLEDEPESELPEAGALAPVAAGAGVPDPLAAGAGEDEAGAGAVDGWGAFVAAGAVASLPVTAWAVGIACTLGLIFAAGGSDEPVTACGSVSEGAPVEIICAPTPVPEKSDPPP